MIAISLRKAETGDAGNIVSLLGRTYDWPGFEHKGTVREYWEWRYVQNPLGFTNEIVALADDKVLSHAASLPTEVMIRGTVRLCSQLSDLFTDPDSRGQGLMEKVMTDLYEKDVESGIELELAFPSPAGYELTLKAGFREMPVGMGHYELITDPGKFFSNVPFGTLKKVAYKGMQLVKGRTNTSNDEIDISEVASFPDDIVALTEAFESNFDLVFRRDEKYLRWRYERPESGIFRIIIASKNGTTSGYVVLRPYKVSGQGYMDVVDLVALPGDRDSLTALIEGAVEVCHQEGANTLQVWLPTNHTFLPELGRMGFLLRQPAPGERRMRLVCRQLGSDPLLKQQLTGDLRYHLVLGDSDWV